MIPKLFDFTELAFTSNGLGRMTDIISCKVTESRNGDCLLEAEYPTNGIRADSICELRYIGAPYDDTGRVQPFVIYKVKRGIKTMKIYAKHVGMITCGLYINGQMPSELTVKQRFAQLKNSIIGYSYLNNDVRVYNYPEHASVLTFYTDIEETIQTDIKTPVRVRDYIQGVNGSIADEIGYGEVRYDRWRVEFLAERGQNSGVVYRYGVNIGDIAGETSSAETYTGAVMYSTYDNNLQYKPYFWMGSDQSPVRILPNYKLVDLTAKMKQDTVFETKADAQNNTEKKKKPWNVETNITLSGYELSKMAEYVGKLPHRHIGLCDTVRVIYQPLGISEEVKVVKLVWDVIKEQYTSMSFGTIKKTLNNTLRNLMQEYASAMR
ncbi:MAG: phage tail protein [Lachnospiraceae bacterium]|nr:phage tail protein [Lachnospiraceae bacterium]